MYSLLSMNKVIGFLILSLIALDFKYLNYKVHKTL